MFTNIYYKSEETNFDKRSLDRISDNESEYIFINDLMNIINQIKNNYNDGDYSKYKKKLKELSKFVKNKQIPYNESIIDEEIIDFCIDRYQREKQDSDCALYGLKIIKSFADSDSRYRDIIIQKDFLAVCQNCIMHVFPCFFPIEIDILNYMISDSSLVEYFTDFDILQLINNVKLVAESRCIEKFYEFLSTIFENEYVSEEIVDCIFNLFKIIKTDDDLNHDYYDVCTKPWSRILYRLILTDFFNPDSFFEGALYDFYERNYDNPYHIPYIGQFYVLFIYRYPELRFQISFDFYNYFDQIQSNDDDENIKKVAYNSLAFYIQIFYDQEQKDHENGTSNSNHFSELINGIPDEFIEENMITQVLKDIDSEKWAVKVNSLFFLANFTSIRTDKILEYISASDYVNLFAEYIQSGFLERILISFKSIFDVISKYEEFNEIRNEVEETETYENLRELVFDDEYALLSEYIQIFLNSFSSS